MLPKIYLSVLLITLSIFSFSQAPVITSFTPAAANAGSVVTIYGSNFDPSTTGNVVYFGGAVTGVLSATANELTVRVPANAISKPITVINNATKLAAHSSQYFRLTFTGGDNVFSSASFGTPVNSPTNAYPAAMAVGDFDFDGKSDAVVVDDQGGNGFYMYIKKNTSTKANISFASLPSITSGGAGADNVIVADINGDAKHDIIVTAWSTLSIFKNTSSLGNISFDTAVVYPTAGTTKSAKAADFDGDGKTDIALIVEDTVFVMKNNSTPGGLAFSPLTPVTATPFQQPKELEAADMDGDGKADIAVVSFYGNNVAFFRNTTGAAISFANAGSVYLGNNANPVSMAMGDLDADGRLDIVTANWNGGNMAVLRNESKLANISFTISTSISSIYFNTLVALGDVNGDGLPDIIAKNGSFYTVSVFKNITKSCSIQFDSKVDIDAAHSADHVVADMNGDGKPEVNVGNTNGLRVFKNTIAQNVTVCSNASATITSTVTGVGYQWQQNTGSGYNNISNGGVFTGTNTAVLQVSNPPVSMNGNTFRCIVGTDTSNVITLVVKNSAVPSVTIARCPASPCAEDTITFKAITTNAGNNASYQWQVNNVNVGTNSPVFITGDIITGSSVKCTVTSSLSCASPSTATASTTVNFNLSTCPAINNVCANSNVTLTSNITGTAYQWQQNTGSGYVNLAEGNSYNGTNTANLLISNIPSQQYGYMYRCVVGISNSKVFIIRFRNTWTGSANNNWENASNWNCGVVPDQNTDVVISSGTINITSNVTIRSLTVATGAYVVVAPGYTLTIVH